MVSEDIKKVREILASLPDRSQMTLKEKREQSDKFGDFFPLPDGVTAEAVEVAGVGAEWVKAPGARDDAVILYFHGGGYVTGSVVSHRNLVAAISEASGMTVLNFAYGLAPENPYIADTDGWVHFKSGRFDEAVELFREAIALGFEGQGVNYRLGFALTRSGEREEGAGVLTAALEAEPESAYAERARNILVGR